LAGPASFVLRHVRQHLASPPPAPPYHFSRSDIGIRTPPALFGQHNSYVYRDVLGLGDEEIEALSQAGHIADTYAPEVIAGG